MSTIQAMILGLVQGITEFLPISSSGHLVILQKIWNIQGNSLLFVTLLHLGTLVAVVWALHKEVRWLVRHPKSWTTRMILVALIPTALIGGLCEEIFENLFDSGITVGFEFVITGCVLWWMDSVKAGYKSEEDVTVRDALWIGALQGVSILPALSRSGLTIATGLMRGLNRESAARFSFLLSIPAILGATVVELDDVLEEPNQLAHLQWVPMLLGTTVAILAGYAAVKGTMWLIQTSRMRYFAVYVWILAALVLGDQLFFHRWFPSLLR